VIYIYSKKAVKIDLNSYINCANNNTGSIK